MNMQAVGVMVFLLLVLLVSTVVIVRATRKRGRRVEVLDVGPQWAGLLFMVPVAFETPLAARIAVPAAATGLLLWSAWAHLRRAIRPEKSSEDPSR